MGLGGRVGWCGVPRQATDWAPTPSDWDEVYEGYAAAGDVVDSSSPEFVLGCRLASWAVVGAWERLRLLGVRRRSAD